METIPPLFWMLIVTLLTGLLSFILYQIGMFIKESRNTLKNVDSMVSDANSIVSTVKGTVEEVNDAIIKPIRGIGAGMSAISGFLSGLRGDREE
ncbi:TPA: hypothetical protein GX533_03515 [Candidatus Dojkabacteria bacterium]|uniref:DUF948 domain-containing protein n=1 Tax=Candidatus Dojkabacteria bacterium TaxID=2099670 RepID=A0A832QDY7_9BACT|nr:hypothetical protein [Candidatus Dojkabacteria bacterium]